MIYPPDVSKNGKRNAFHHYCDVAEGNKAFAACLSIIDSNAAGKPLSIYESCNNAVKRGTCPAVAMRAEEATKGEAIFFEERVKQDIVVAVAAPMVFRPMKREDVGNLVIKGHPTEAKESGLTLGEGWKQESVVVTAPKPKSLLDTIVAPSMGEVITKAYADEAKKVAPETPKRPAGKIQCLPGETPAQALRRMKSNQQ